MPRLPVDGTKVIEHRYTLGQYERDQLDTLITGITVRNVGTPIVSVMGNPFAILSIVALAEAFGLIDLTGVIKRLGEAFQQWVKDTKDGAFQTPQAAEDAFNLIAEITDLAAGPEFSGVPTGPVGSYFQYQLNATEKLAVWVYTSLGNIPYTPSGLGGVT